MILSYKKIFLKKYFLLYSLILLKKNISSSKFYNKVEVNRKRTGNHKEDEKCCVQRPHAVFMHIIYVSICDDCAPKFPDGLPIQFSDKTSFSYSHYCRSFK